MSASANVLAAALEWLAPGHGWTAVCVWCLHAADPHEERPARRAHGGGDCSRCPYTGPDMFVFAASGPAEYPLDTVKRKG